MDEQKNGTPAPRRRRRADVQRPMITEENEADFFQPEAPKTERAEAPRPHSEVRKPVQSSVQRQVWEEEYDDFDDVPARKRKKKRGNGTGCLIGIIIVLLLVIVVFALGWIVFPNQKDEILSQIGLGTDRDPDGRTDRHADA